LISIIFFPWNFLHHKFPYFPYVIYLSNGMVVLL